MHTPFCTRLLTTLGIAAIAAVASAQGVVSDTGGDGLRWTPHRAVLAASGTPDRNADPTVGRTDPIAPEPGPRAAADPNPTRAVPFARPMPDRSASGPVLQLPATERRIDPRGSAPSAAFGDVVRRAIDPANPQGIFGAAFNRAPQGEIGRPMLGDETRRPQPVRQTAAAPARRTAGTVPAPRTGSPGNPRAARAPRIALNADGLPSVLSPAPAAAPTPTAAPLPAPRGTTDGVPPARSSAMPLRDDAPGPGEIIIEGTGDGSMPPFDDGSMNGSMVFDGGIDGGDPLGGGFGGGTIIDDGSMLMDDGSGAIGPGWTGDVQLHVPSPYDDPFACEDCEPCGCLPFYEHDGRICAFLRRFGKPYYGWRWYRDLSASAGVTSFQNPLDLGLLGNYGFNEYVNWGMPFWNALGVGWQVGVRGVQTDFQSTTVRLGTTPLSNGSRNQVFLTTGFYTRAFEGRGLQGGAVWDYLHDDLYDDVSLSQIRGEVSYVWGFNEFGFWGAANTLGRQNVGPTGNVDTETIDIYAGFYRVMFGDANEAKIWSGGTGDGDFIIGSLVRAPMNRSLALEGTFTYLIPQTSKTIPLADTTLQGYSGQAWNLSVNVVWIPACRARRGLASPYRPLFEVADNGSMIRSLDPLRR